MSLRGINSSRQIHLAILREPVELCVRLVSKYTGLAIGWKTIMRMATILIVTVGILSATVIEAKNTVIRQRCIGNRCALYDRGGPRIGSVTYQRGRVIIRDRRGNITRRITEQRDGSLRAEAPRRRR